MNFQRNFVPLSKELASGRTSLIIDCLISSDLAIDSSLLSVSIASPKPSLAPTEISENFP